MKQSYHKQELRKRLEHLNNMKFVVIEEWEVREWWQRARITTKVYEEILETWHNIAGDSAEISGCHFNARYVFITPNEFTPLQEWIGKEEDG